MVEIEFNSASDFPRQSADGLWLYRRFNSGKKAEKADKNPKSVALQEEERLPHISLGGGVTVHYHVAPMVSVPDGVVDLIGGVALAPASNGCTSDSKLMSLIHTAYNRHCLKCGDEPN